MDIGKGLRLNNSRKRTHSTKPSKLIFFTNVFENKCLENKNIEEINQEKIGLQKEVKYPRHMPRRLYQFSFHGT
jgi:hypothetical protein